jgi:hypothetical protein
METKKHPHKKRRNKENNMPILLEQPNIYHKTSHGYYVNISSPLHNVNDFSQL